MNEIKATQNFRHRGFQMADGTRKQLFGNGPAPLNDDGSASKELWDNDIEQTITTRKHQDVPGEDDALNACQATPIPGEPPADTLADPIDDQPA